MKLIHKFKSPNFNGRNSNRIKLIIIHYTAIGFLEESLQFLCSKKNRVSCHYLISQKGEIFNLVSDKKRAWHAGKSYWKCQRDINSLSIGIELDYSPNHNNNKFTAKLIKSLSVLLKNLKYKYKIKNSDILAHSDIAPYRKIDPGAKFPWKKLIKKNLAFYPVRINNNILFYFRNWLKERNFNSKKNIILFMLDYIGYDISIAINNNAKFLLLIQNYQNRYLQRYTAITKNDKTIQFIENHFCNLLLTNQKK